MMAAIGPAGFEVLSFDCYGTLIDWEQGIWDASAHWRDRTRVNWRREKVLEAFGRLESELEAAHPEMPYPNVLRRVLRGLGERAGAPPTDDEAAAFGASVPAWSAFADSREALEALEERHRLVILSNVDRASFAASKARLGVTFTAVLTAEDVGAYKPDARNFHALLQVVGDMGIERERLLHVAQSLYHDHAPAREMGIATAWIDRRRGQTGWGATPPPRGPIAPDFVFASMKDLAAAMTAAPG